MLRKALIATLCILAQVVSTTAQESFQEPFVTSSGKYLVLDHYNMSLNEFIVNGEVEKRTNLENGQYTIHLENWRNSLVSVYGQPVARQGSFTQVDGYNTYIFESETLNFNSTGRYPIIQQRPKSIVVANKTIRTQLNLKAEDTIRVTGVVAQKGSSITLKAKKAIYLEKGFLAELGSKLQVTPN